MGRKKKYFSEDELKEANRKKQERWREKHPEENSNKVLQWREDNPELWRAMYLVNNYKRDDKKHNRGECTITGKWIVNNIFNKTCKYCGKTDWKELGCDRIINDLPHTPENVVPCCDECNRKRHLKDFEEFLKKSYQKR